MEGVILCLYTNGMTAYVLFHIVIVLYMKLAVHVNMNGFKCAWNNNYYEVYN